MKKLFFITAMVAVLLSSCTPESPGPDPATPQNVIFSSTFDGGGFKTDDPFSCSNPPADYAMVVIEQGGTSTTYYPDVFYLNGVLYTQAIKLAPGDYQLVEFTLMHIIVDPLHPDAGRSDDETVNAAPHAGSTYGDMLVNPLPVFFTVNRFEKLEVPVEILCYEESSYADFGFIWFKITETTIRKIIFYGDFCDEYFADYEGSKYGNYPKVDMPAIFKIEVNRDDDYDGVYENTLGVYDNESDYVNTEASASVPPLEVPYIDREGIEDRYELKVYIYEMIGIDPQTFEPVFDYKYFTSYYFSDNADALLDAPAGSGTFIPGEDGVYDFTIGFCAGTETDIPCDDPDECIYMGTETAFAYGEDISTCFLEIGFHRWGWTNLLNANTSTTYDLPIYAGAGQCDITKGTLVGTLSVVFNGDQTATVTYNLDAGFIMDETHLYLGPDPDILPLKNGIYTVAPGQYPEKHDNLGWVSTDSYTVTVPDGDLYLVAHAVVKGT